MKRLLAIFAHPDDEGAVAGTLAFYARQGVHVALICTTKGEAGEISDPTLATPENLGSVREAELRCACEVIGIDKLFLLDYCDSGMDGTAENQKVTAFIQADPDDVRRKMVKIIRDYRPHVIITFEPEGWYGHPDHIATGRYATEAFHLAADTSAFPEIGIPWRTQRLYHAAMPRGSFKVFVDYAVEHGLDIGLIDAFSFDEPDPIDGQITHTLDVNAIFDTKEASRRCHQTQFGDNSPFMSIPIEVRQTAMGHEHFIQVHPAIKPGPSPATDLFDGSDL